MFWRGTVMHITLLSLFRNKPVSLNRRLVRNWSLYSTLNLFINKTTQATFEFLLRLMSTSIENRVGFQMTVRGAIYDAAIDSKTRLYLNLILDTISLGKFYFVRSAFFFYIISVYFEKILHFYTGSLLVIKTIIKM